MRTSKKGGGMTLTINEGGEDKVEMGVGPSSITPPGSSNVTTIKPPRKNIKSFRPTGLDPSRTALHANFYVRYRPYRSVIMYTKELEVGSSPRRHHHDECRLL